jgi:hypothetical protein
MWFMGASPFMVLLEEEEKEEELWVQREGPA